MSKPTGGPRPPGKKPVRTGGKPGKTGAYSKRLIQKATAGVRPPRPGKRGPEAGGGERAERDVRPASGARFNGSKRSFAGPRGPDDRKRPDSGKRFEGSQRSFATRDGEAAKPARTKRVRLDRNAPPERPAEDRARPYRERNDRTRRPERMRDAHPERSGRDDKAGRVAGPSHPNDARGSNRDRAQARDVSEARSRDRQEARTEDRERASHRTYGDTRRREEERRERAAGRKPAEPQLRPLLPSERTPGSEPRPERARFDARPPRDRAPETAAKSAFRVKPAPSRAPGPNRAAPAPSRAAASAASGPSEPMRIAKAMARSGLCSRRDAERWIADGRVAINGRILTTPGVEVGPTDKILVDGQPLPAAEPAQIWRYYKPRGLVTTHADPEGRPTVFDALPPDMPRVVSIGRLDFNTEGLLLLTNDGELARHLELPATGWLRRYRVRAYGRVTQEELNTLKDGITIEGVRYGGIDATLDSVQAGNMWLTIGLREGKNREVRRILGSLALEVNRLIRISYGPFQLTDLTPGMVEPIKRRILADQLGPDAAQFGLTGAIDGYKARHGKTQRKAQDDDE